MAGVQVGWESAEIVAAIFLGIASSTCLKHAKNTCSKTPLGGFEGLNIVIETALC